MRGNWALWLAAGILGLSAVAAAVFRSEVISMVLVVLALLSSLTSTAARSAMTTPWSDRRSRSEKTHVKRSTRRRTHAQQGASRH